MSDLEAFNIRDGIFVPAGLISKTDVIYDSSGRLVKESCQYRGPHPNQPDKPEDCSAAISRLPDNLMPSSLSKETSIVFLGEFDMTHYGHWLTEGLSRFWYLLDNRPTNGVVMSWSIRRQISHIHALRLPLRPRHWPAALTAFNIATSQLRKVSKPTRYAEIIVPCPSMVLRSSVAPRHFQVLQRIAKSIITKPVVINGGERIVYLSRRLLRKSFRSFENEIVVEDFCRSRGFEIVYPERLSLVDQIEIISEADALIGFPGSAFHTVMFRRKQSPLRTIYLSGGFKHDTIPIIDAAMGNESYYIDCCSHKSGNRVYEYDADKAVAGLKQLFG